MMASDFQRKLRKLNKNLHIYCGDNDSKLAGLYHVVQGEYRDIIGVDKNFLPEWPQFDEMGRLEKSGWRRVVKLLIEQKLVDRKRAEAVFGTQIMGTRRPPAFSGNYIDPIELEIQKAYVRGFDKTGKPAMQRDEVMDLAKEIGKKHEISPNHN